MMPAIVSRFAVWISRLFDSLLRVQLSDVRCTSISGDKSIALDGKFLSTAAEFQVEFAVQWPIFSIGRRRLVSVGIVPSEQGGLEADLHARAVWSRGPAIRVGAATVIQRSLSAEECVVDQSCGRRVSRVRLRMAALSTKQRIVRLEIRRPHKRRPMGMLSVQVLDPPNARKLMLDSLKVENQRLWIQNGARCDCSELVADTSDYVIPEFTIPGTELSAFEPQPRASLTLNLLSGEERIRLTEQPVTLAGGALEFKGPAISVKDPNLFPQPGSYCLVASLGHRDIATFPFRIVAKAELLRQMKLGGVRLDEETGPGRLSRGARALHWDKHTGFQVSFQVETQILAPNSSFRCTARISQGARHLWLEEFILRLNYLCQRVSLQKIDLKDLGIAVENKPARLSLTLYVENEPKHTGPIIILPRERISNFEGQLCIDPENLAEDDAEYARILDGLGTHPQAPQRRWFRKRASGAYNTPSLLPDS